LPRRRAIDSGQEELGLPEVRPLWETGGLFSDHYLNTRLRQNTWWPSDDQARTHWEFCRDLYNRRYLALARGNEAAVRQELIDKVLKQIGFDWIDNLGLPDEDAEPDYLLFGSAAEKETVLESSASERYRAAVAILEAKRLHHPLSQLSKHQVRYPHQQIRDYLLDAQMLGWGILTNGNLWRLYCRDAKRHEYFELNFEVAIQSLDAFKCFLVVFSPDAFRRSADGRCRLDEIRDQAANVQTELEDNLRQRVFTILADLANGFASRPENGIGDKDLETLYHNCLIYLYRLLFVLYAEGRDLLPVNRPDRKYMKNLSLARLRGGLRNFSEYDDRHLTRLCESVRDLFRLINGANVVMNRDYGVPRYNGGLFDPEKYPLIEKWAIADPDLAAVLRGLMFSPPPERDKPALPIQTVDFADLRVQHLGSIYEGLLEHHLIRGEEGRLRLDIDRAERKATGTYYTPDYIVKYIVENTVGPLLKEIEDSEAIKTAVATKQRNDAFAERALKLNILDPAMGSGHFLVEAVTFLADHIVHHPTTRYLDAEKRGEPKAEQEIAHWRRRVVEACIYGVDLNPLAVELAKLSLWLVTIATDSPLNFLDHHLRCGNSLVGARLDDLSELPEKRRKWIVREAAQIRFRFGPDFKRAVSDVIRGIHAIEAQDSDNRETVKNKEERWHREIEPRLRPFSAVADLWTSAFFGREMDEGQYVADAQRLLTGEYIPLPEAESRRFFHWELAFPEVFFNDDGSAKENPGFDAVIGNPPYVRIQGFPRLDVEYLSCNFATVTGNVDVYVSFVERGFALLKQGGQLGEIVPNKFFKTDYGLGLRKLISEEEALVRVVDFGSEQVFAAGIYTCLLFLARRGQTSFLHAEVQANPLALANVQFAVMAEDSLRVGVWTFSANTGIGLSVKIREQSVRLLDLPATMSRGSSTGDDAVFMVSGDEDVEEGICRSPVFASDFGRYVFRPERQWRVIFPYVKDAGAYRLYSEGELEQCYPKALAVLVRSRQKLEKRKQYARWYGYSAPRNLELHDDAQICVPLLADHGLFAHLPRESSPLLCPMASGGFTLRVAETIPVRSHYVLAILNSQLLFWELRRLSNVFRGGWITCTKQYIGELPIRRIDFTTPGADRKRHGKKVQQAYERGVRGGGDAAVLALVDEHMKAARTDVVHDLLAFLAERMTAMNKEKHETARGFLTNLKDFHGVDAHSLKPKTRLDEFWTLEPVDVFAHLKANVRALAAQGVRLKENDEEKIRNRFQKAKDRIIPLEAALSFTDRLIDRIVYRLYDLTPEEIRIVEGPRET